MAAEWNLRVATTEADILKVMVVRGIVFIEEQQVDWEGEIDEFETEAVHFLGEVAGQPVATGRLRSLGDGRAKIERIAVRPAWRGQGYAQKMMHFVLDHAAARGLRVDYQVHGDARPIESEAVSLVFATVQEALSNIAKRFRLRASGELGAPPRT